jgi:ubiquinone/menaquinone biosynthesis C-methylase UbiE/uncharacterized protein YbaR (Trm112 family)
MNNINLSEIRMLYREGVNIIDHLRNKLAASYNTEQLVEISYDMQSGSYIKFVLANAESERLYHQEMAGILGDYISEGDIVVDVGTGEMTTLAGVALNCYEKPALGYALDISLSRLLVGQKYLSETLPTTLTAKIRPVVSTLFHLPFADESVDLVWTNHALEPNGSREYDALAELARVTCKWMVLFEPSYEHNTEEGRQRMDRLGYVKNIPAFVEQIPGLKLERIVRIEHTGCALNPTYAHIIRKTATKAARANGLRCPLTTGPLTEHPGYLFSRTSLLAYPIIEGIPVLRAEKGICASALDTKVAL